MKTLEMMQKGISTIPTDVAWYLSELGEFRGRQQLFVAQAPQKLKALKDHALVESAISSNRIEGVEVDGRRVGTLLFGSAAATNRDEEEVRGYRLALEWIHSNAADIGCHQKNIQKLHALVRGDIWDAGKLKERDGDIIERLPNGERRGAVPRKRPCSRLDQSRKFGCGEMKDHDTQTDFCPAGFAQSSQAKV